MLFWNVPAPDEALLISGSKRGGGESQFKIVTGHGAFVLPIFRKARYLSLALREAAIEEQCVSQQGIPLKLRAVAVFKIGDDPGSIANAARRFLAEQNDMDNLCGRIFAGHLRSIVGSLTVEDIIRERDKVAQQVKEGSHSEMEKLGIIVDALQIQEIEDPTGYISNLAAPHAAVVASATRRPAPPSSRPSARRTSTSARPRSPRRRSTPRSARPRPRPPRPARSPRPRPRRASSPSRPRSRSAPRSSPSSAWSPRSAAPPTPRPTASARSPRPPATRPSSAPRPRPSSSAASPRRRATRRSSTPRPRPPASASSAPPRPTP